MLPHTAEQIMTRNVITIRKGSSLDEAIRLMAKHHVSGLPVVDVDNRLVGIITETDLLLRGQDLTNTEFPPIGGMSLQENGIFKDSYRKASAVRVEDAMTSKVVSFQETSSVADIARVMLERNINRIPILRDGKVVGIISRGDIIKSMAALDFDEVPENDSEMERPRLAL